MELRIFTYAKVNLYLDVVGKFPNGYHQIESIFQNISISDEIVLKDSTKKGIYFLTNEEFLPTDNKNLVIRAVELLRDTFKIEKGLDIYLRKNIPIGGGLGGGSSNCAGTLVGLNILWNLGLSREELLKFAFQLGADVPFFLTGGTCAVGGIGDVVSRLPHVGGYYLVLINPGFPSSTADVYRHFSLSLRRIRKRTRGYSYNFRRVITELGKKNWKSVLYNRLEIPAFRLYPELREIKEKIRNLGYDNVCMSGSGSTIFVIFDSESQAQSFLERFSGEYECYLAEPVPYGYRVC